MTIELASSDVKQRQPFRGRRRLLSADHVRLQEFLSYKRKGCLFTRQAT